MKNKYLIIFFISCILSIFIYRICFVENKKILLIGEKDIINYVDNDIENFLYDRINYYELYKSIKNNDKKIIKEKDIYLNQLIHSSRYIIIYTNSFCYNDELVYKNIELLSNEIKRISNADIYFVRNRCNNRLNNTNNYTFIDKENLNNLIIRLSN